MNPAERFSRQEAIIPREVLCKHKVTVVGIGAIGRNCAIQLASIGVPELQIIDFDTVEESNICTQGYLEGDLGEKKVDATEKICRAINSTITIDKIDGKFKRSIDTGDVVFCCVDNMDIRKLIWEATNEFADLFIDGRMSAEALRVLSISDDQGREHYPTTLFSDQEAYRGSCTALSTVYCANIAAGFLLTRFTKWIRGMPSHPDVMVNLLSDEIIEMEVGDGN